MKAQGIAVPYVELEAGGYLLEALFVVGPASRSAMGEAAQITWLDLWAYGQTTGAVTEPWEYETLMAMSRAYLDGLEHGKNHFALSPLETLGNG
jgi:hypothetical protein